METRVSKLECPFIENKEFGEITYQDCCNQTCPHFMPTDSCEKWCNRSKNMFEEIKVLKRQGISEEWTVIIYEYAEIHSKLAQVSIKYACKKTLSTFRDFSIFKDRRVEFIFKRFFQLLKTKLFKSSNGTDEKKEV